VHCENKIYASRTAKPMKRTPPSAAAETPNPGERRILPLYGHRRLGSRTRSRAGDTGRTAADSTSSRACSHIYSVPVFFFVECVFPARRNKIEKQLE
jgi:hypothetical protein